MDIIPPIQGECDCCGEKTLVQANFVLSREAYEAENYTGIPYEHGRIPNISACHPCLVGGKSGQFDEWTDEGRKHFWETGNYLETSEVTP